MQSQLCIFVFTSGGSADCGSDSNASNANAICLDPGELLPDDGIPSDDSTEHEQCLS